MELRSDTNFSVRWNWQRIFSLAHVRAAIVPMLALITVYGGFSPAASARSVTDAQLYQTTLMSHDELKLILIDWGFDAPRFQHDTPSMRPRQIWQRARSILVKLQRLQKAEGLPQMRIPLGPSRDVSGSDLQPLLEQILEGVGGLKAHYGVTASARPVPLRQKIDRREIYIRLLDIGAYLDVLSGTKVKPTDVYRVIMTLQNTLLQMCHVRGLTPDIGKVMPASGKSPRNVYLAAHKLLARLDQLARKEKLNIPGGLLLQKKKGGRIVSHDMLLLAEHILAEATALHRLDGAAEPVAFFELMPDRIPSHVFTEIEKSIMLVEAMI